MYRCSDLLLPSKCRTRMPRNQYYSRMVNCPRPDLSYPTLGSGVTDLAVSRTQPGGGAVNPEQARRLGLPVGSAVSDLCDSISRLSLALCLCCL